jgi:hypothetical protein
MRYPFATAVPTRVPLRRDDFVESALDPRV